MTLCLIFFLLNYVRLCDEATSALDSTTEASILNSLKSLSVDRTSIFIAHRLTTAMQCDQVCFCNFSRFKKPQYSLNSSIFQTIYNYKASQYTLEWQLLVGFIFSLMNPVSNLNFQIIVLENGKVIEQGPHDVLLSKGGRYAELWFQQNNSDTIDPAAVNLEV